MHCEANGYTAVVGDFGLAEKIPTYRCMGGICLSVPIFGARGSSLMGAGAGEGWTFRVQLEGQGWGQWGDSHVLGTHGTDEYVWGWGKGMVWGAWWQGEMSHGVHGGLLAQEGRGRFGGDGGP